MRVSAAIMQSAQLSLDQAVEVRAEGGRIIIEPVASVYTPDELLNGITDANRHGEMDFGGAQGQK